MTLLGETRPDIPFQACNKFQPTLLEGQVCYSLNLSLIQNGNSKSGERAGLLILIDQGIKSGSTIKDISLNDIEDKFQNLDNDMVVSEDNDNSARIYLNTLSSFTDNRAGSFAMSSLKKMTGTDSFLGQTDAQKKCRIETLEDCTAKMYLNNIKEKCGCVPWALNTVLQPLVVTRPM